MECYRYEPNRNILDIHNNGTKCLLHLMNNLSSKLDNQQYTIHRVIHIQYHILRQVLLHIQGHQHYLQLRFHCLNKLMYIHQ